MNPLDRAASAVTETWVDVDGWPYKVSDTGRVWSEHTEKVLKPYPNETGDYLVVDLRDDGDRKQKYVHTLVLETHAGKRPEDHEAHHIDGDPLNNEMGNLEWREIEDHDEITEQQENEDDPFAPTDESPF